MLSAEHPTIGATRDDHPRRGCPARPATRPPAPTWSLRTSFWLVVGAQVLLFAGSNFPTPLFPIYEHRYGFGSGRGHAAVRRLRGGADPDAAAARPSGRPDRPPPTARRRDRLTVFSSVAFAAAQSLAWLFAGEIIYGFGGGHGDGVRCRRHPRAAPEAAHRRRRARVDGCGRRRPHARSARERIPRVGHAVADGVAVHPRHRARRVAGRRARAHPRDAATRVPQPQRARRSSTFRPTSARRSSPPRSPAPPSFMVVGWVFGLSPSYLHEELNVHITQPVVAGLFAALVVFTNGVAQLVLRRHHSADRAAGRARRRGRRHGRDGRFDDGELTRGRDRRRGDRGCRCRRRADERDGHDPAHRSDARPWRGHVRPTSRSAISR